MLESVIFLQKHQGTLGINQIFVVVIEVKIMRVPMVDDKDHIIANWLTT